jgi:hypothetical protein
MPPRIGIVIANTPFFSNGMNQNAIFLRAVCLRLGYECNLLCYSEDCKDVLYGEIPVEHIDIDLFDVTKYNLFINTSAFIGNRVYERAKAHKIPVVGYICSNTVCMSIEEFATKRDECSILHKGDSPIDTAWVLEAFDFVKTYTELLFRVKTRYVPHLWSPSIIETYMANVVKKPPSVLLYTPAVHTQKKITIVCMDPNINFVKTAFLPLCAAEKLHLAKPDLIDKVYIFGYPKNSKTANMLVANFSIGKQTQMFVRKSVAEILLHFNSVDTIPIFVNHQIYTPLNYSYYEMMYYGVPFVHNSPMLKEYGYYYDELDINMCAVQILNAYATHAKQFEASLAKNRAYLEKINPNSADCAAIWKPYIEQCLTTIG